MKIQVFLVAALVIFFSAQISLACEAGRFTANADGTVTDTQTGLTWKRCLEGQSFSSGNCTGTAEKPIWSDALAKTDTVNKWRVPNIKELQSLVDVTRHSPAINTTCFPTPIGQQLVWSASPYAVETELRSWVIDFQTGAFLRALRSATAISVRLVRD